MAKKGIKWIGRELVMSPYCIGLCKSKKQFEAELDRRKAPLLERTEWVDDGKDGKTHFFEGTKDNDLSCIVCIKKKKSIEYTSVLGLLVHEAVHIWQAVKDELNEKEPSLEFEAYSIQAIAQRLIEAYGK